MIQIQINPGVSKGSQKCSSEDLKNVLQSADKNKDGQVTQSELKSYNKKLNLLGLFSDSKELKELSDTAKFAQENFALLNCFTNIGSEDKGIDLDVIDLVAKMVDLSEPKESKDGFIEVLKFFMHEMIDTILDKKKDD